MKLLKTSIIVLKIGFVNCMFSQNTVYRDNITAFESDKELIMPWAGGINFATFSKFDLNFDGKMDLVVFDKVCAGGRSGLKTYLNEGTVGVSKYIHAPIYQNQFPKLESWAIFMDYNNDEKVDVFTFDGSTGITVYKNTSANNKLDFKLASKAIQLNYQAIGSPSYTNVYSTSFGMPGIVDIDNDGDLDIITQTLDSQSYLIYNKNLSQERFNHSDSLMYVWDDKCWGDLSIGTCTVMLNSCSSGKREMNPIENKLNRVAHAGLNSILCFDRDGDGDKDLILSDADGSCHGIFYGENTGTITKNMIGSSTYSFPNFPNQPTDIPINLKTYPVVSYLDIDNDGFKDLIASPYALGNSENFESVWYYKNASTTPTANFVFQKKNFLQEDMIDLGEGAYPVLFDADSDGKKDLIVGNHGYFDSTSTSGYKSKLAYYRNIGTASSPSFSLITRDYQNLSRSNLYMMAPTFGDMDNDGDQDLIIGDFLGKVHYYENTANNNSPAIFSTGIINYKSINVPNYAYPQLFDVDKNGTLDLIIGSIGGKIAFYSNTGTPTTPQFNSLATHSAFGNIDVKQNSSTGYSVPFMFNEGGKTKLIVGSESGNMYLYDNIDGNLTGKFNKVDTNFFLINEGPRSAAFYEDITNDGKRDLFVGNYAGGLSFFNSTKIIGIEDLFKEDNIRVYPNPASEELTISLNDNNYAELKISCIDVLGKTLFEFSTFNKTIPINISNLSKGIYFIQLQTKGSHDRKLITKKIIVQ